MTVTVMSATIGESWAGSSAGIGGSVELRWEEATLRRIGMAPAKRFAVTRGRALRAEVP
ncbi:MAG: hypothetical protein ACO3ZY_02700 [Phycisphaerales bacterium]